MQTVKVRRDELLAKLRANKDSHLKIVTEALDNFRVEAIKVLEQAITDAKAGKRIVTSIGLQRPMNMTQEYETAIAMMEMSVDTEIELSLTDFRCYVLDQWGWRSQFLASNRGYSKTAEDISALANAEE